MCGIAGFYGFRNDNLITLMSGDMLHRGPDGEGYYIDDTTSLLCRRLAIIGRADGDQPIYNEDRSLLVVYNGEIYNYQALRAELENAGHQFSTHSDTEVIVHAYEQWGKACFDRFNGMFGLALYDRNTRQLVLARDHFGIKPLYFSQLPGGKLIFASEIKPLLHSNLIAKKPNDRIIYRYLNYRVHDDLEETFFEDIYRLMPGEMMIVTPQGLSREYYSSLRQDLEEMAERPAQPLTQREIETFREKLIEAIKLRLVSEVPVGTCLSGGLDSSTVVAVVSTLLEEHAREAEAVGERQNTFSAVFPGSSNDEERYIDAVRAKYDSIKSWKVSPQPGGLLHDFEDFVRAQEEPITSTGPYAQYKVMQEAAKHVTVLLDGQGADEMMAGYLPYYIVYLKQLLRQKRYRSLLVESYKSHDILRRFVWDRFLKLLRLRRVLSVESLLNPQFRQRFAQEHFPVIQDHLKKRLIEDIFHNSLPSLLRYEDKNGMRFSLEGRVPFLDGSLLHFLFSLSDEAIIHDGWNKHILRTSMRTFLPRKIARRRNKIGFTTPEYEWFMRLKKDFFAILLSESFASRPYFDRRSVLDAFLLVSEGKSDDTMLFWRILNVEMWLRVFFDEPEPIEQQRKALLQANPGKSVAIQLGSQTYARFPVQTDVFQKGDPLIEKIAQHVGDFLHALPESRYDGRTGDWFTGKPWFIVISEKVVAIAQGRSYFVSDIKPSPWARLLSRFVARTPAGIGLGSPWTMQLAIKEVGLPRILLASVASAVTKPFGIKGLFYRIAGWKAASIDGPTEYSLYPSNVSAKLGPQAPDKMVQQLHEYVRQALPEEYTTSFQGAVIIDANDLGQHVLGNSTPLKACEIEQIFKDNPMGQQKERTPITVVFPV